jgi:anti-anti-sigma factor
MRVAELRQDDEVVLELDGVVDASQAPALARRIDGLDPRSRVVLDLSKVKLIDGCGMSVIIARYKRPRDRWAELRIVGASGQPRLMFRALRLERLLGG